MSAGRAAENPREVAATLKSELINVANRLHPNRSAAADLRYCETLVDRIVAGFERELAALGSNREEVAARVF